MKYYYWANVQLTDEEFNTLINKYWKQNVYFEIRILDDKLFQEKIENSNNHFEYLIKKLK